MLIQPSQPISVSFWLGTDWMYLGMGIVLQYHQEVTLAANSTDRNTSRQH
jgi:hypothetical protein